MPVLDPFLKHGLLRWRCCVRQQLTWIGRFLATVRRGERLKCWLQYLFSHAPACFANVVRTNLVISIVLITEGSGYLGHDPRLRELIALQYRTVNGWREVGLNLGDVSRRLAIVGLCVAAESTLNHTGKFAVG